MRDGGLLDADIYGPSVPTMFGVMGRPVPPRTGKLIEPLEPFRYQAHVDRLPLGRSQGGGRLARPRCCTGALLQFVKDVLWQELHYLILDLPPGTGDVALTISQLLPTASLVIVHHAAARRAAGGPPGGRHGGAGEPAGRRRDREHELVRRARHGRALRGLLGRRAASRPGRTSWGCPLLGQVPAGGRGGAGGRRRAAGGGGPAGLRRGRGALLAAADAVVAAVPRPAPASSGAGRRW